MNIDWNEVKHSLVNLKNFVEKSKLMWGICNEYIFDEKFHIMNFTWFKI